MAIIGLTPADAASVNLFSGQIATTLWAALRDARNWNTFLLATDLTLAPYSFSTGDQATIKSSYADLKQLADIHDGLATLGSVKDFNTFAKLIRRPV